MGSIGSFAESIFKPDDGISEASPTSRWTCPTSRSRTTDAGLRSLRRPLWLFHSQAGNDGVSLIIEHYWTTINGSNWWLDVILFQLIIKMYIMDVLAMTNQLSFHACTHLGLAYTPVEVKGFWALWFSCNQVFMKDDYNRSDFHLKALWGYIWYNLVHTYNPTWSSKDSCDNHRNNRAKTSKNSI
jgi:hypothetical protein